MTAHEIKKSENDSEVSLLDILIFLKGAWKTIASAGILGLVVSSLYLFFTPSQYEAVAKIQMARISELDNTKRNIEEPAALISRMSLANSFDHTVMSSCGVENQLSDSIKLLKVFKLTIPKGVPSVVELKVTLRTPESAKICASSIIESISKSQIQKVAVIQEANQARITKVNERLSEDKILLTKASKPEAPISVVYFSLLSNIRSLEDEREGLLKLIDVNQLQDSTQQSLIYGLDKPIYPKKAISLLAGLLGGLLIGILTALAHQMIAKLKAQSKGVL
jgi:uncharacterized protein involved in exopolysaccharide biosynthesis